MNNPFNPFNRIPMAYFGVLIRLRLQRDIESFWLFFADSPALELEELRTQQFDS